MPVLSNVVKAMIKKIVDIIGKTFGSIRNVFWILLCVGAGSLLIVAGFNLFPTTPEPGSPDLLVIVSGFIFYAIGIIIIGNHIEMWRSIWQSIVYLLFALLGFVAVFLVDVENFAANIPVLSQKANELVGRGALLLFSVIICAFVINKIKEDLKGAVSIKALSSSLSPASKRVLKPIISVCSFIVSGVSFASAIKMWMTGGMSKVVLAYAISGGIALAVSVALFIKNYSKWESLYVVLLTGLLLAFTGWAIFYGDIGFNNQLILGVMSSFLYVLLAYSMYDFIRERIDSRYERKTYDEEVSRWQ